MTWLTYGWKKHLFMARRVVLCGPIIVQADSRAAARRAYLSAGGRRGVRISARQVPDAPQRPEPMW